MRAAKRAAERLAVSSRGPLRTALVVGAARSGVALALHLTAAGEAVRLADRKAASELQSAIAQLPPGVDLRVGGYDDRVLDGVDVVYASPGVPWDSELLNQARAKGIPVSSEIDLFLRLCKGSVVGITGTNGKTTTTALTGLVLEAGQRPGIVGGQIGRAHALNPYTVTTPTPASSS